MNKKLFISLVEDASMTLRILNDILEANDGMTPADMTEDEENEVQNLFTLMEELQGYYYE